MKKLYVLLALLIIVCAACGRRTDEAGGGSSRVVLQNKGSDTLVNVAQAWAENYKDVEPNVAIAVTGGGSGTGISSLINGTVDIANSSRKMKQKEIDLAKENGVEPVEWVVGYDALAVFLHADNPIDSMTIEQLASIYGDGGTAEVWSDLGVSVPGCDSDEIVRVSRQNNSGTYAYFKEAVLGKTGEYKLGSRDMHGSKDVVDLVENTPCAIGYSGLAYAIDHIKMPCIETEAATLAENVGGTGALTENVGGSGTLAENVGGTGAASNSGGTGGELENSGGSGACVTPSVATASDGTYPIARPLLMYTAGEPTGAIKVYLDWILSDTGQCIMVDKGYAPAGTVTCG